MTPVYREVHDDEIVLSHDTVDGRRRMVEVVVERREGPSQPFAALRSGRVLDEVLSDETKCRAVAPLEGLLKGQHGLRRRHCVITHETGSRVRVERLAGRPAGEKPPASTSRPSHGLRTCALCRSPASAAPRSWTSSTGPTLFPGTASSCTRS